MDLILDYMRERRGEIVDFIRRLAECESPTSDPAAVERAADMVAAAVADIADVERFPQERFGPHLRLRFRAAGSTDPGHILGLGHLDTVYPLGTLARMPVRERDGRLQGPGVFDMKSGVAYFLFAARALRDLDVPARRRFVLQLNSDEEVGSPTSRPLTEEAARGAAAVLVAEPAAGLDGRLKTARKGGGAFTIRARGRAAHAGLDFASGVNAIVELARQIERVASWTDLDAGVTVNPGVMRGGTASNVVPDEAWVEVDVRVPTAAQAAALEARFAALEPFDPGASLEVEGGLRRPPMEPNEGTARLFDVARRLSAAMGVELGEAAVGGGSDGNFTAALGVPTLDGLGGVGEGAHSENENIRLDRVADRAALIAKLLATL